MPLKIVQYPHPVLKHVSRPLKRIDAELRATIREMFDLMYQANGIGLAANQVALPYRLFVINLTADPAQADQERVFINPVLSHPKGTDEAEEGCLSLPGLYRPVRRPASIRVHAYDLTGREIEETLEGLFSRAVQHETDHLDGVLFIDRLPPTVQMAIRDDLDEFESQYAGQRQSGEVPDDAAIAAEIKRLEALRT